MVVCERIGRFVTYIADKHWASLVAQVDEFPAVPSLKEAVDRVYNSLDSERLEARRSMGVAASVHLGHVGVVGTTTG